MLSGGWWPTGVCLLDIGPSVRGISLPILQICASHPLGVGCSDMTAMVRSAGSAASGFRFCSPDVPGR